MKILIIEHEIYLAQAMTSSLVSCGHTTTHVTSIDKADINETFDVLLICDQSNEPAFLEYIKTHKKTLIIILAPYISDVTVNAPLKAGASDYLVKPFEMDELIRKINMHTQAICCKRSHHLLESYITNQTKKIDKTLIEQASLPLILNSNDKALCGSVCLKFALDKGIALTIIDAKDITKAHELPVNENTLLHIENFNALKVPLQKNILAAIVDTNTVLSNITTSDNIDEFDTKIKSISLFSEQHGQVFDTILSIDDYVKSIILKFQATYTDVKISQMLGFSRKSLWEKRKKFCIEKKKYAKK